MWFLIYTAMLVCFITITHITIKVIKKRIEKIVIEKSHLISDVKIINEKYHFDYAINSEYTIFDECKNKRAFDKYDYEWNLKTRIEKNPDLFKSLLLQTYKNKELWDAYCTEYENIDSFLSKEDIFKTTVFFSLVEKRERELYASLKLKKPTTRLYTVLKISYTSPAGYNHYTAQHLFLERDVEKILADIESKNETKSPLSSKSIGLEKHNEKKRVFHEDACLTFSLVINKENEECDKYKTIKLSKEQEIFVSEAKEGKNILVDACIGSGKTTAIQKLCDELDSSKRILYLTYNTLLKIDAKEKIKCKNAKVTNYHGFAYGVLKKENISVGRNDSIQQFNLLKPPVQHFDILILDEYQDIDQEIADMLEHIKIQNPGIQIVAVGDMDQKIYDKTTLNIKEFITQFLGQHIKLFFTICFRLPQGLAKNLGEVWNKRIVGVNNDCVVEIMDFSHAVDFLSRQKPEDVLCLGSRTGPLVGMLNSLEQKKPEVYNKKTVYASIRDTDSLNSSISNNDCAIFTTYDSSKGLERKICVIFDYTESYWNSRIRHSPYETLRNIFCVAASRGKQHIVFVKGDTPLLSIDTLKTKVDFSDCFRDVDISEMFDFKYSEDIEECYHLLEIHPLMSNLESFSINVKGNDERIDLSPCIGIYQEAVFFKDYDIDKDIVLKEYFFYNPPRRSLQEILKSLQGMTLENKILYFVALETKQNRYLTQVSTPFITQEQSQQITDRLGTQFQREENVQVGCSIHFSDEENGIRRFSANGYLDVLKDGVVYELKFVTELQKVHFLQCACYMAAQETKKGVLWNVRDNSMYGIEIPDKKAFLNAVAKTITKGKLSHYHAPQTGYKTRFDYLNEYISTLKVNLKCIQLPVETVSSSQKHISNLEFVVSEEDQLSAKIAVIDTETNYKDEVMSIGVVIASAKSFHPVAHKYYVISPECAVGGVYSNALNPIHGCLFLKENRKNVLNDIRNLLNKYEVSSLFSYSSFDYHHLNELSDFCWYDIMKVAAYKQYNHKIPDDAELFSTGRLKRYYKVGDIYKLMTGKNSYEEMHNALQDALDELEIMELLNLDIETYKNAILSPGQLRALN